MTDIETWLKEVEEYCDKATDGPWGYCYDGSSDWSIGKQEDPQEFRVCSIHDRDDSDALRNAPFIANSRTDLPKAISIIRELQKKVKVAEEALEYILLKCPDFPEAIKMARQALKGDGT